MSTAFDCSACGKSIAADVSPGQQVICPFCNATITAPGGVSEAAGAVPPQLKTGMAVTAMVFGIIGIVTLGFCSPLGAIGCILGIIALVRVGRVPDQYGGKGMAIAGICTGAVSCIAFILLILPTLATTSVLLPSLTRAREMARRAACASNLRQVGIVLVAYAEANNDALPPDLDTLIKQSSMPSNIFICPAAVEAQEPYIYVPVGTMNDLDPQTPWVIENPENHGGKGGNVLYGDTHTEWVPQARLTPMLDDAGVEKSLP